MEALYLVCGARRPQLKRNPLGSSGHMKTPLAVCRALIVFGLGYAAQDDASSMNPQWAVILPPDSASSLIKQCTRETPRHIDGTWQPMAAQVSAFEKALTPILERGLQRATRTSSQHLRVRDYYRQYGGLVVDGKQIIYVNAFHREFLHYLEPDTTAWRRSAVDVCDGGEWFFGAEYDVLSGQVRNLHFNGHA